MRKVRIAYVALELHFGGLQRVVSQLIRRINGEQFEPILICLDHGGIFGGELEKEGIPTYVLNRRPGPIDWKVLRGLYKILALHKVDLIHSQNGCSFYSAVSGQAARVAGIIHTDHGRLLPDKRTARLEDRFSSWLMDRVVGVSSELTEYLASVVNVSRRKLATIINGVDCSRFMPMDENQRRRLRSEWGVTDEDRVIGTVCRLDPIKNLGFFIRSMPEICRRAPMCKLIVVGDGPCRQELEEIARNTSCKDRIVFIGSKTDIEKVMPAFDLYACTSLSEGTSMTILEAMACGLPIVASAVGGNGRLVGSENGALFPLNDSNAFIQLVTDLLSDPDRMIELGRQSRTRAEMQFGLDKTVMEYEQLYRVVLSGKGHNIG
ncbi:MAG: glycosyltransferase [Candidatus Manganitrophus sp.]|nr:glycosyltransferase [Candidatus Manganitrophus sp.]WDT72699.1 MAG: glycosyltransferase [Candidatus Manganitrophus sp.]